MKKSVSLLAITVMGALVLGTGCSSSTATNTTNGTASANAPAAAAVNPELDARHAFNTVSLADEKINDIFLAGAGTAKDKSGKEHAVLASYFAKEDDVLKVLTSYMSDSLAKSTYDSLVDADATQKLGIGIVVKDNVKHPIIIGDKNLTYKDVKINGNDATLTAKEKDATITYTLSKDSSGKWQITKKSW